MRAASFPTPSLSSVSESGPLVELDLRDPQRHLVAVTIHFQPSGARQRLALPSWTPGSYLIRDYVRHLEALQVEQDGASVPLRRTEVASWLASPQGDGPLVARYRILAADPSVRTCDLDDEHAFLALAAVVLEVEGQRWHPHRLSLRLPSGWHPFVSLPALADGTWQAADFDHLIDSPVCAGPHPCHSFSVAGVPHRWVSRGGDLPSQDPCWLDDVERIALACCRLMGVSAPASDSYLFVLNLLEKGYGGLEHDHGCVLQYGRLALARANGRRKLLQLVAHEYLHQWNVRRLRPAELTPIDYQRPMIVPSLWFAEGVTSYFDMLIPVAAGICDETSLLEDLGAELSRYRLTPGRFVQSLRSSSEEAWVKLYRQDAYSADNQISYYLKGTVLALILDLHLRRHGSWLGEVLQDLWRSHGSQGRGYQTEDLFTALGRAASDLAELLPRWLESTEDPELDPYLADLGLVLVPDASPGPDFGWQLESQGSNLLLSRVSRDGAAERAGLRPGDELLAIDGRRIRQAEDLPLLVNATPASDQPSPGLEILCARDGRLRSTTLRPNPAAVERWRLEPSQQATEAARDRRRRWCALEP